MRNETYKLEMPKKYRELTEEEMEYDGGFFNFAVAAIASVASIGFSIAATVTGNKRYETASYACTAISVICSCGVTTAVGLVNKGSTNVALKAISTKIGGVTSQATYNDYCTCRLAYGMSIGTGSKVISGGLIYNKLAN